MFTPDAFYDIFQQCFLDKNQDLMIRAFRHGEKDLFNYVPYLPGPMQSFYLNSSIDKMALGKIFLYDQEPIFPAATDVLRQLILDQNDPGQHDIVNQCTFAEILALWYPCTSFPIWCTSDKTGIEIDHLVKKQFIICDYWYHAFIARDWYRHYQYLPMLAPVNKHQADYRMIMYCRDDQGTRAYRKTVKNRFQSLREQIWCDWDNDLITGSDFSAMIDFDDAQRCGIHLVLETLFETDKKYLTEKIFKPIVMSQPFIIWGPPGTLAYLKEYGFRTFDHAWSESYDNETDHNRRMNLLLSTVEQIAKMSDEEYYRLYQKCLPVVDYNRQWFYSDKFMSLCWQKLQQNWNQAKEIRTSLLVDQPGGQFFALFQERPDLLKLSVRSSMLRQYLLRLDQKHLPLMLKKYPVLNEL